MWRLGSFIAIAVILAAAFVRLGFWQLDRLGQRRQRNAMIERRMAAPVEPFERLRDTTSFHRAAVTGTPDYDNEIVLTGRSREGSPGVYILTPVRRSGLDTAVVVLRGWVYAPDAATVELPPWRERRTTFTGYVALLPLATPNPAPGRKLRALSLAGVRGLLPYPVDARYLVARDSGDGATPARVTPPALDDGPHLSYAIQWFSFAIIALAGATAVVVRARVSPPIAGETVATRQ